MKIIFLDFDGPLIPMLSYECLRSREAWPACVAALNRITDTTGAKIVVSSTWRQGGLRHVTDHLAHWGVTGEVIGTTPRHLDEEWKGERVILMAVPRGREIAAWLADHPEVDSFVILDDDRDMCHLLPRLVHTPFESGLTEQDADRAIAMLEVPYAAR